MRMRVAGGLAAVIVMVGGSGMARGQSPDQREREKAELVALLAAKERPITLSVENEEVSLVLNTLSEAAGISIAAGADVQGKLTIILKEVPLTEAFLGLLAAADLEGRVEGNVIVVRKSRPEEETPAELIAPPPVEAPRPVTAVFRVEHANLANLKRVLEKFLTSGTGALEVDLSTRQIFVRDLPVQIDAIRAILASMDRPMEDPDLEKEGIRIFELRHVDPKRVADALKEFVGQEGRVVPYGDSNSVLVAGPVDRVREVARAIERLDVRPRQVSIEAVILDVEVGDATRLASDIVHQLATHDDLRGTLQTRNFAINPATNAIAEGGFISLVTGIDRDQDTSILLDMLQSITDFQVLAHPKVTALNDQEAHVIVGSKLGYRVTTTTQTSSLESIEFLEVGTQLRILPHITDEGRILLKLTPKISTGQVDATGLPSEDTTELTTTVLVQDGETLILGGLIETQDDEFTGQIPILGDIPFFGFLFRENAKTVRRREILILLTPRIQKVRSQVQIPDQWRRIQEERLRWRYGIEPPPADRTILMSHRER